MTATITDLGPHIATTPPPQRAKTDAACCTALTDAHGRLPVGYCSPTCERRSWDQPAVMDTVLVVMANG